MKSVEVPLKSFQLLVLSLKMVKCVFPGCVMKERHRKEGISFFTIPRRKFVRKLWLTVIGKSEGSVCEKHFRSSDFVSVDLQTAMGFKKAVKSLKDDAVPKFAVVSLSYFYGLAFCMNMSN